MIANSAALVCKNCASSSLCCSGGNCLLGPPSTLSPSSSSSSPASSSPPVLPSTPNSSPRSTHDAPTTPTLLEEPAYFGVALTHLDKAPGTRVPLFVASVTTFLAAHFGRVWPRGSDDSPPRSSSRQHVIQHHHHHGAAVGGAGQNQLWRMVADCDDFFFPPWRRRGSAPTPPPSVVLLTPASLHSHMACAAVTALQAQLDAHGLKKTLAQHALPSTRAPERLKDTDDEGGETSGDYPTFLAELLFCVFLFLEKLPHALVPHKLGDLMIQTRKKLCTSSPSKGDEDRDLLLAYKDILLKLPPNNYHLLAYLLTFLRHLWQLSRCEPNLMENLVTAFSCTVYLGSEEEGDVDAWWFIVRALMIHSDEMFPKELRFVLSAPNTTPHPGLPCWRQDHSTYHLHQTEQAAAQFVKIYKGEKALILPFDQILLHSKSESPTPPINQSRSSPDFKALPHHRHHHHHPPLAPHTHNPDPHCHHHAHHRHPPHHQHPPHRHAPSAVGGLERSRSQPSSCCCCSNLAWVDDGPALELSAPPSALERRAAKFYFGPSDEDPLEAFSQQSTLAIGAAEVLVVRPRLEMVRAVPGGRLRLEEIMTRFEELSSGSSGNSSLISSIASVSASPHKHPLNARASTPDLERHASYLTEDIGGQALGLDPNAAGDSADHHPPSIPRGLSSKRGSDATLVNADFFHAKIHLPSSVFEQALQAPHGVSSEAADDLAWLEKQVAKGGTEKTRLGYSWRVTRWATNAQEDPSQLFGGENQSFLDENFQTGTKPDLAASRCISFFGDPPDNQLDHKDLPAPSPPATHHAYKDFFENGIDGASFHALHQKLQTYEKKLEHYEEIFERENGYKPFVGDKETMYEIKKYTSKIEKVKKELKAFKGKYRAPPSPSLSEGTRDEVDRGKRFIASAETEKHKPRRHSSPCGAPDPSPHLTLLQALQAYMPGAETLVHHFTPPHDADTLDHHARPTFLSRETLTRLLEDLNPEVLWKQKVVLQRVLLHFERVHGKPTDKATIDLMRPLYCKYRRIKNILAKYSEPRHAIPELPTIIEGHQWDADSFDTSITSRGSFSSRSAFFAAQDQTQNESTHHNRSQFTGCARSANRAFDPYENLAINPNAQRSSKSSLGVGSNAHAPPPYQPSKASADTTHPVAMGTMETSSIHSASLQELLEERRKIKAIRHRYKKLAYIPVDLDGAGEEGWGHPSDLPEPVGAAPLPTSSSSSSGGAAGAAGQQRASTAAMKRQLKMYNYDNNTQQHTSMTSLLDYSATPSSPPVAATTTKRAYFLPNLEYYETYKMAKNKLKLVNALIAKLENQKCSS